MYKWWTLLFGLTMAACFGLFLVSPALGWWLPEGNSTHADQVDWLFYLILYITGFFFVLTEALLVWFMYKYGSGEKPPPSRGYPEFIKKLIPDQHRLEIAWTIVPAAILLLIAFTQVKTWADVKYRSRMPQYAAEQSKGKGNVKSGSGATMDNVVVQIEVTAKQFEWRIRYPSSRRFAAWRTKGGEATAKDFASFPKLAHIDDVNDVNHLHVAVGQPVLVQLKTIDVIHSFNLPHLRVKQDALPGQTIPVWFTPTKANTRKVVDRDGKVSWEDRWNPDEGKPNDKRFRWDLACAELCGWWHYHMIGRLYVHESMDDLADWLKHKEIKKNATEPEETK